MKQKLELITLILITLALGACSGNGLGIMEPPPENGKMTPAQAITNLEKSGVLPKLDRTKSVAGIVTNQNGIRDDINTWITAIPASTPQKKALIQHAKALQAEIIADSTNPAIVEQTGVGIMRSTHCIFSQFSSAKAIEMTDTLKKMTYNTKERFLAAAKMSAAANGSVIYWPQEDTCE